MIYSLKGRLTVKELGFAVIECGGVGYGCRTSYNTISQLVEIGSDAMLYTYLYVREDVVELFGFASQQELSCFKLLITVSGVGPKAAVSILSDVSPERFAFIIASGDSKTLTRTKGIGAKTAQRIVLELKDKIKVTEDSLLSQGGDSLGGELSGENSSAKDETVAALVALGYNQSDAMRAVRKVLGSDVGAAADTVDLLKLALKEMF